MLNEAGTAIATIGDTSGVALTSAAFGSAISWFPYVLAIAVVLFAFSTMISWSYYGLKAWTYLFGEGKANGAGLQGDLLRLHRDRRGGQPRPGHRLLRCGDLLPWRWSTSPRSTS